MKNRDNYLSTAKAIGIILMVVGHSGCSDVIERVIYYFHMPLFFFCSGYFFVVPVGGGNLMRKIIKRFRGLYLPYLRWSLLFLLFHNLFYTIGIYNDVYGFGGHAFYRYTVEDYLKRAFYVIFTMDKHEPLLGGFWFIKILLLSSVLVLALTCLFSRMKVRHVLCCSWVVLLIGLFISKYFECTIPYVGDISVIMMGSVFYVAGNLYNRGIENKELYSKHSFNILLVAMLFTLAFCYHSMSMYCSFGDTILYLLTGFVGIFLSFTVAYMVERFPARRYLYYIGKNTLTILAMHFLAFKLVSIIIILTHSVSLKRVSEIPVVGVDVNVPWWILYSFVGVSIPMVIKFYYERGISIWRRYFLQ